MKKLFAFVLAIVMLTSCCCVAGCNLDDRVKVYLHDYDQSGTPLEVVYNSNADLPTPTRNGYTFGGWYYDKKFEQPFERGTVMSQSFDLYAKWVKVSKTTFTVTLVFGDGRPDEQLIVEEGKQAPLPQASRTDYRFDGWWTLEEGGVQWGAQPITSDITLYARWQLVVKVTHKVTLVFNDGATPNRELNVEEGKSAQLPTPNREGFNFDGWYLNSNCTVAYSNQAITQDLTLFARWKSIDPSEILPIRIAVTPSAKEMEEGSTFALNVKVYPDDATNKSVQWFSSDTTVATVSDGVVSANAAGTATITANSVADPACTATVTITVTAKPTVHTVHDFGDNYFMYVKCSYVGCEVVGRNQGSRNYDNMLTFSTAREMQISQHYDNCVTATETDNLSAFLRAFALYEQDINYLSDQYYWVSLYSNTGSLNMGVGNSIVIAYNSHFVHYYELLILADETFHESFWTAYGFDRESALFWAEVYTDPDNNSDEVNSILEEYRRTMSTNAGYTAYDNLYGRLVAAYNKEAAIYGYDSYIEYAYREIYNREYSPSDTDQMHRDVKEHIAPALVKVNRELDKMYNGRLLAFSNADNRNFYNTLTNGAIVNSPSQDATNYVANYFKWLNDNSGTKPIDFFAAVNDMFKTGNYFTGRSEGAYTMYVPGDNVAAVYVMNNYRYDLPFTFVHEFGHYYNYVHNGGVTLSYDHDETQSQGNEMLFLAWLKNTKPNTITDGMKALELTQLASILNIICIAAAVDELEQAAYIGTYQGVTVSGNYHRLFGQILDSYGSEASALLKQGGNQAYWYYVAFDNAAYYISYAMSALSCVELYTIAETQSVETAKDAYFKLFTYCEDQDRMNNYAYTGENGVLRYSGLDSAFDAELYLRIDAYVDELCPDN